MKLRDRLGRFIRESHDLRVYIFYKLCTGLGLERNVVGGMNKFALSRLVTYRCTTLLVLLTCTSLAAFVLVYKTGSQLESISKGILIGIMLFAIVFALEYLIWFHDQVPIFLNFQEAQSWIPSKAGYYTLITIVGMFTVVVIPLTGKLLEKSVPDQIQSDVDRKRFENSIITEIDRVKSEHDVVVANIHEHIAHVARTSGFDVSSINSAVVKTGRKALIIALSKYQIKPLDGVAKDAVLMKRTLEKAGYEVTMVIDKPREDIERSIRDYGRKLSSKDLSVVYVAGHGVQQDNINYLIPIEAIGDESEPTSATERYISLNNTINQLVTKNGGARYNLFIFDACRDFREGTGGLAKFGDPSNRLGIVTSADAGQQAADSCTTCRGHGPFAFAFSKHFTRPLSHDEMVKAVKREVGILLADQDKRRVQIPSFTDYADRTYIMANSVDKLPTVSKRQGVTDRVQDSESLGDCFGLEVGDCLRALKEWASLTESDFDLLGSKIISIASKKNEASPNVNEPFGNQLRYWRVNRKTILGWLGLWGFLSIVLWFSLRYSTEAIRQYHLGMYSRSRWILKHSHLYVDDYIKRSVTDGKLLDRLDSNWDNLNDFYPESDRSMMLEAVGHHAGERDHIQFARSVGFR